jgi:hypothetical protein
MAPPRKESLHAPANRNVSGALIPAGLTVSPKSKLSATDILGLINTSDKLPEELRRLFHVNRNRIVVWIGRPRLPPGMTEFPEWFANAVDAINWGQWHLTTGTANIDRTSSLVMSDKIVGDYEDSDQPAGGMRSTGIVLGETVPTMSSGSFMGLRKMSDENAGGGPRSPLRRPPVDTPSGDTAPGEGLIVVGTRFRDVAHIGPEVPRAPGAILETFFHELAAHAALIDEDKSSDHSDGNYLVAPITDTDILAKAVHDFFANPSEQPLIDQATVNIWERAKQDSAPPSTSTTGPNVWERAKSTP